MLQPQVQQSDTTVTQLGQACDYLVGHQMKPTRPGPEGNPGLVPHTVLRTLGAHSNSPEKKAKRPIMRLLDELTFTLPAKSKAHHQTAEILASGKINDSANLQLIHK
jgi:hypothetical protein